MSSKEVDSAVGEAPARSDNGRKIVELLAEKTNALDKARYAYAAAKEVRDEQEMSKQGQIIDSLHTIIRELKQEAAVEREAIGKQAAAARVIAIKRALGSVSSALDDDENKLAELLDEITTRLNDRYEQTTTLRAEGLALADRFDLPKPTLPDVIPPGRRAIAAALVRSMNKLRSDADTWESQEQCEHKMRTRRTYAEAEGTPGAKIIESAGLKPFPELTDQQRATLSGKAREHEEMRRQFAGLPRSPIGSL